MTQAWFCPVCDRATVKCYRCSNWNCQADLAGKSLEQVDA